MILTTFHLFSILITLGLHQALGCWSGIQVKTGSEAWGHYLAGVVKRFEFCYFPVRVFTSGHLLLDVSQGDLVKNGKLYTTMYFIFTILVYLKIATEEDEVANANH